MTVIGIESGLDIQRLIRVIGIGSVIVRHGFGWFNGYVFGVKKKRSTRIAAKAAFMMFSFMA
jgi:hypothetical protein